MIKSANNLCFVDLLSPQSEIDRIYKIPDYQRPYAWTQNNCEDLYNDLIEADLGYFVGSMIYVNDDSQRCKVIIDGQQRFTTLSLFLIAIYEKISAPGLLTNNKDISRCENLKEMLVTDDGRVKLNLQLEQNNKEDYEYLIDQHVNKGNYPTPNNFGNRRMGRNFKLICDYIKELDSLDEIFELLEKIKRLTFVSIEVEEYQSAYQLFEAMNNRGLALTPVDLIKNIFISKTGDAEGWMRFVQLLGDDPRDQDQFFRYNYNAFRAEYNEILDFSPESINYPIAPKAVKSNIIKIYQQIIQNRQHSFIEEIVKKARIYNLMLGLGGENENKQYFDKFENFRNAKATNAFILLMYLYNYKNNFRITDEQLLSLFDKVLIFFVRRNLTNNPSTGAVPGIQMNIIEKINKLSPSNKDYTHIQDIVIETLRNKTSPDDVVRSVLSGDMYQDNRDMTRFLLCKYEEKFPVAKEKKMDFWSVKNNKYVWTIEHIFPEGSNIPKEWVDMIANGNEDVAKKYLNDYCHKLGNLTLTGYNSELSNKPFEYKKELLTNEGEKVGYNNGLHLNEYVYNQQKWTIDNIKDRTNTLVDEIMKTIDL